MKVLGLIGIVAVIIAALYYAGPSTRNWLLSWSNGSNQVAAEEAYGRGVKLALADNFDGAITAFSEALEHDPSFVAALVNRGNVQIATLNYDAAFGDYAEAIRRNPDGGEAYISRGQLYWLRGDLPGARADFEKVIELEPDNDFIYLQLAKVLGEMDRFEDVVKIYERAYRGDRRRKWALWLWLAYLRLPDTYDRLLQTANRLRREGERSLAIEYNRGLVYHFRRNYRAAIPLLVKAIDNADPDFIETEAYDHLATAYRNIGRSDKCRERVDQYAKRFGVSEISYEGCIRRPWH